MSVKMTKEELETLLCDCGGEDPTFCLAHGDRAQADPCSMALDVTAEELTARVEAIVAARVDAALGEVERRLGALRAQSFHNNGHIQMVFRDGIARAEADVRAVREEVRRDG